MYEFIKKMLFLGCLSSSLLYANPHETLVILGSGPAGLTAAIYASRAQLEPLVFEGSEPGGQLVSTTTVDNFPGFPEGITGTELIARMHTQAERFGARFMSDRVERVDLSVRPFKLTLENGSVYTADTLIIATGSSPKWLGLHEEKDLLGYGVSTCATCDGFLFKNKEVIVVGGGDTAAIEALFLATFVKKVTLVHRRCELRANPFLQEKIKENEKIEFLGGYVVDSISDASKRRVTCVKLREVTNNDPKDIPAEGVFIAIGQQPNTMLFQGQLEMDEQGLIKVYDSTTATSVPGVFVAGDVAVGAYRQAITAAATGGMAAIDAEHFLMSEPE